MEAPAKPTLTRKQIISAHTFLVYQQLSSIGVYTVGRMVMSRGLHSSAYVVIRLGVAAPFMLGASIYATKKVLPEKKFVLWMIVSGMLSVVAIQGLLSFGLTRTTPTNTSIINAPCTPLFTTALSIMRGTDKLSISKACGFIVSLVGALILLKVENFSLEGEVIGNLMVIGASFSSSLNTLIQRKMLDDGAHPIEVISHTTIIGLIGFVGVFANFGLFQADSWHLPSISIIEMLIIGTLGTTLPWTAGSYALKNTSPMTVSIYVVLQPPLSALLGFLLGEEYTWHQAVGSVLILLGLFFVVANAQAKALLLKIYAKVVARFPSHKKFQALVNKEDTSSEEEEQSSEQTQTEMVTISVSVSQDGASVVEMEDDGTVYAFKEHPTNDMLLENEHSDVK